MSAPRDSSKEQDDASVAASFARSLAGTPLDPTANDITLALSGTNSRVPTSGSPSSTNSAVPSSAHNIDMLMSDITNAVQSNIAAMDQQSQQLQLQQQQAQPDARMAIAQQLVSLSQNNSRGNDLHLHGTTSSAVLSAAAAGVTPQDTPMYKSAVDYVSSVKKAYENNPQVYKDFMTVLESYNSLIIPAEELVRTVMSLFQDQPDLLLGFKEFIPETQEVLNHLVPPMMYSDYKAPVVAQLPAPTAVAPPEAADFLSLIKERSQQEPDMYQHLITLLRNFKKDSSYSNLYFYVSIILRYHPHLLQRFHKFLPAVIADCEVTEPRIISKAPPEELVVSQDFIDAKEFIQSVKHAAKGDMSMYDRFIFALEKYQRNGWTIDQVYSEVSLIFWNHPDLLAGFKNFISSVPTPPQP
ncbi:Paired amphipathic helix protein Sin3b [Mortierella hygrophila]|uniref:Paired amphipathic helix protein Sin3b n=1 Tax=Mortierella hygrophila TaxID=979708 RepID=A0A9P6K747_9FUNG|nr:Paired amphipathic helix protein Sin3b [Mortierella hygrophila]